MVSISPLRLSAFATPQFTLIDERKNKQAKSMKFVQDGSKSKNRTNPNEKCANCTEYTKVGKVGETEVGRCNKLTGGVVQSIGWCAEYIRN